MAIKRQPNHRLKSNLWTPPKPPYNKFSMWRPSSTPLILIIITIRIKRYRRLLIQIRSLSNLDLLIGAELFASLDRHRNDIKDTQQLPITNKGLKLVAIFLVLEYVIWAQCFSLYSTQVDGVVFEEADTMFARGIAYLGVVRGRICFEWNYASTHFFARFRYMVGVALFPPQELLCSRS